MTSKALYLAYRDAATKMVANLNAPHLTTLVTDKPVALHFGIGHHAHVTPTEDGAYVELSVWVPLDVAEHLIAKQVLAADNRGYLPVILDDPIRVPTSWNPDAKPPLTIVENGKETEFVQVSPGTWKRKDMVDKKE